MNVARDSFGGYATGDPVDRREPLSDAEQLVVTEVSPDGAARATVGSSGALVSLELSERVRTMPPRQLASLIETCVRRAQAGAAQRVSEIRDAPKPVAAPPRPRSGRPRRPACQEEEAWVEDQSFMVRGDGRR